MDVTGVGLAVAVTLVAGALLYFHVQQVKRRPATGHDKLMGALWAGLLVLALARTIWLLGPGDAGGTPAGGPEPAPQPAPIGK